MSLNDNYDYEPLHYFVAVAGTIVAGPMPWDDADRDRMESEDRAEDGETVELIEASRGDMDRQGLDYRITRYTGRSDLDQQIARDGGLMGALEAGIVAGHMPEGDGALRAAWERLEAAVKPYVDAEDEVNRLLDEQDGDDRG